MTKSRGVNRAKWRPDAVALELVRRNFADSRTQDLADALGVAYHQIAKLAQRMGLTKSAEWLNGPDARKLDGVVGLGTRFQKGEPSWCKGMKGLHLSPRTQFKPGQRPVNYKPVGSFRVMSAGYLQLKVHDTGYPPHDYVMYHRHVWEKANGPIPDGHRVCFKPGRRTVEPERITVDALELVSASELMARNSFHQYGPEVARVVQLRGALTRQINRRERHEQDDQRPA